MATLNLGDHAGEGVLPLTWVARRASVRPRATDDVGNLLLEAVPPVTRDLT